MAKWESSPERKAINQHLHRKHDGYAGHGSTENRLLIHEHLHARTECDHFHPEPINAPTEYKDGTDK